MSLAMRRLLKHLLRSKCDWRALLEWVIFKQLLQAGQSVFADRTSAELAGSMKTCDHSGWPPKFKVPVCPHGRRSRMMRVCQLCHLFDYGLCYRYNGKNRLIDLLITFTSILKTRSGQNGCYLAPTLPVKIQMKPQSLIDYEFPMAKSGKTPRIIFS